MEASRRDVSGVREHRDSSYNPVGTHRRQARDDVASALGVKPRDVLQTCTTMTNDAVVAVAAVAVAGDKHTAVMPASNAARKLPIMMVTTTRTCDMTALKSPLRRRAAILSPLMFSRALRRAMSPLWTRKRPSRPPPAARGVGAGGGRVSKGTAGVRSQLCQSVARQRHARRQASRTQRVEREAAVGLQGDIEDLACKRRVRARGTRA